MKLKNWFSCILLLWGGFLSCVATAQGTFNANNNFTPSGASAKAYILDISGNPLAKASGRVELRVGGTTVSPNGSAGVALTLDGLFFVNGLVAPGTGTGGTALVEVRAWDASTGGTYDAATVRAAVTVTVSSLGGGTTPPATFGNNSTFTGLRLSNGGIAPPVVTVNPVAKSITEGQSFTVTATITGVGVAYRWQRDGVNLTDGGRVSGATTQTLTITGALVSDAGNYRAVGSNAGGTVATTTATVTVTAVPFISQLWALSRTATEAPAVAIDDGTGTVVVQTSNPGRLTRFDLSNGSLVWEVLVSGGNRSAPTIIPGGQVVFGTDSLPNGWVYGYNLSNGEKLWERNLGGAPSAASFDGADALYFGTVGNNLGGANQYIRLDRAGVQKWKVGAPVQSRTGPVILKSGLLVYGGGSFNKLITAVRASDGGTVWSFDTGGEAVVEPALGPGGRILATSLSGKIFALNASTGAKLWETVIGTTMGSPICDAAGRVYVGARGGKVIALNGSTGAKIWEMAHGETGENAVLTLDNQGFIWCGGDKSVIAVNSADGAVVGRYAIAGGVTSVMIAKGGILVARTGKGAAAFRARGVTGMSADSPWPTWRHDAAGSSLEGFTSEVTPPTVATSPVNTSLVAGQTLTLTASISGNGVSYRWQKDGQDLVDGGRVTGATTQTLTITGVIVADAGQYRLMAANGAGTVFTTAAVVTVDPPLVAPTIISQPQSVTAVEGDRVVLSVTTIGNPAPVYRWLKDGVVVSGQTSSALEIPALTESDAGAYRVVVSNSAGSSASAEAVVVCQPALRLFADGVQVRGTLRTAKPVNLELQFTRPDWIIFYTVDGSTPDFLSTPYGAPFLVDRPMDLRFIAYSPDFSDSRNLSGLVVKFVQPQTIAWTALPTLRYPEKGAVGAVASSGLPVVVSLVSGPATLSGVELTATGVGDVVLRAVQVGDEQFAGAVTEQTVTISKGIQSLTWPTLSGRTFGDAAFNAGVAASSGLGVTVKVVSGKASLQGANLTMTGAGTVVLSATQAGSALYESVTENRSFEVAKAAQTISFPAIADRPYSPDPITLVATSSSKLPVAFELVAGPAQVSAGKLTLTGVGAVTLRAVQAGNDDYLAAAVVERSFIVSKATQTLTFTALGQRTFGDPAVKLVATSSAGLDVAYRIISGPGSVDGQMLSVTAVGTVVIQAFSAGNALYQAAATSQSVTVVKAPQSITFTALPDVGYSTTPIVVSATAKSQLPVTFRLVGGPATLVGDQLSLTGVGAVSVAAEQAGNGNWLAASPVTNRFTVTRGTQTITFEPVPEQVVGNPPVTLQAASSVGLPMLFEIVSGPATVSGKVLTVTAAGRVTVRARQVGSPLWLPAQVEQTFEVIRMTTLSVSVADNLGGSVTVTPSKERYLPTETVTLKAVPAQGFRFDSWSGDLSGTENPKALSMVTNRVVVAAFKDSAPPVLSWELPKEGQSAEQTIRIVGVVTDNVGVASLRWSRDGGTALAVAVGAKGAFLIENILLTAGSNRIRLIATDAAGNITSEEREIVWVPERVLQVVDAAPVQEGQRISFPILLRTQKADVAGATFRLEYESAYLAEPQVEWSALVGQSVNSVNSAAAGVVSASFALAGTALPVGTNVVATVSFRARSVPFGLVTPLNPRIESLASPTGAFLNTGNVVESGGGRIAPRKIKGDNNANQRLDVGDAVVISRLQVGLEERRTWDLPLNDLNSSGNIDSGDVVKVLRVVVGMDPQPKAAPRVEGGAEGYIGLGETVLDPPLSASSSQIRGHSLRRADVNANDVIGFEFPDGNTAKPGVPWRVVVKLAKSEGSLSGLSFSVNYPSALTLTHKQVGGLVPSDALPLWAENPGTVRLAAVRSTLWPTSTGVAAVLTFLPTSEITTQRSWAMALVGGEISGGGFDVRLLDDVRAEIPSVPSPDSGPRVVLPDTAEGVPTSLEVEAAVGTSVILETTTNLTTWAEERRITGQGLGKPVRVSLAPDASVPVRFWRVRVP